MFNDTFYPTPRDVVWQMIRPYTRRMRDLQILEPSAGKGDILDVLVDGCRADKKNLYCIELEDELAYILQSKGYQLIDRDFTTYTGQYDFDLILMNPPFNAGVTHLLRAWEILRNGDIVCLLNAETIKNPYSTMRQVLKNLIASHGSVEEIGKPFLGSQRSTAVEVVLVRLHKETPELDIEFGDDYQKEQIVIDEEFLANPLAKADMIEALVAQYEAARRLTVEINTLQKQRYFYLKDAIPPYFHADFAKPVQKGNLNEELQNLNAMFWRYVFEQTAVGRGTTSEFQRKFTEFRQSSSYLAFTRENVLEVFGTFVLNKGQIMDQCMNEVFDSITAFHEKNKIHNEGWKTNKSWKVAQKIIWPYGVDYNNKWGNFTLDYRRTEFLSDLDKVMCYLQGCTIDDIVTIKATLQDRFGELGRTVPMSDYADVIQSTFFDIRFFKKGTTHLTFRSEELWQDFNTAVAKSRNWLGAGF